MSQWFPALGLFIMQRTAVTLYYLLPQSSLGARLARPSCSDVALVPFRRDRYGLYIPPACLWSLLRPNVLECVRSYGALKDMVRHSMEGMVSLVAPLIKVSCLTTRSASLYPVFTEWLNKDLVLTYTHSDTPPLLSASAVCWLTGRVLHFPPQEHMLPRWYSSLLFLCRQRGRRGMILWLIEIAQVPPPPTHPPLRWWTLDHLVMSKTCLKWKSLVTHIRINPLYANCHLLDIAG